MLVNVKWLKLYYLRYIHCESPRCMLNTWFMYITLFITLEVYQASSRRIYDRMEIIFCYSIEDCYCSEDWNILIIFGDPFMLKSASHSFEEYLFMERILICKRYQEYKVYDAQTVNAYWRRRFQNLQVNRVKTLISQPRITEVCKSFVAIFYSRYNKRSQVCSICFCVSANWSLMGRASYNNA